jgi:hypothetical protein
MAGEANAAIAAFLRIARPRAAQLSKFHDLEFLTWVGKGRGEDMRFARSRRATVGSGLANFASHAFLQAQQREYPKQETGNGHLHLRFRPRQCGLEALVTVRVLDALLLLLKESGWRADTIASARNVPGVEARTEQVHRASSPVLAQDIRVARDGTGDHCAGAIAARG